MENGSTQWDVFIAHASADALRARELYSLLKQRCRPFLDVECLEPGQPWDVQLAKAQRSSRMTALLISRKATDALYAREEASVAVALYRSSNGAHRVVPVYLDGPLSVEENTIYGIFNFQALNARTDGGFPEVASRIAALLNGGSGKPVPTPLAAPAHPLLRYRSSPAVEPYLIRRTLVEAYAAAVPPGQAALTVDEAIAMRVEAEPGNPELRYLSHGELPPPENTPPIVYWNQAFKNACLYGPRMVAALLLAVRPDNFPLEAKSTRSALLTRFELEVGHVSSS